MVAIARSSFGRLSLDRRRLRPGRLGGAPWSCAAGGAFASGGRAVDNRRHAARPRPRAAGARASCSPTPVAAAAACSCSPGRPGIGKTALLEYAREQARRGCACCGRAGSSRRREMPFAGLLELLRPALGALDRDPGAAGGGARRRARTPARRRRRTGSPSARRRSACSRRTPSDAPLVAARRRRALARRLERARRSLFAMRRLIADPIAVGRWPCGTASRRSLDGARLRVSASGGSTATAAARCSGATARPPAGRSTGCTARPRAIRSRCSSSRRRRCAWPRLPVDARRRSRPRRARRSCAARRRCRERDAPRLVLAAASDNGDLASLGRAAAALRLDVAELAPAETAGLVALQDGRVEFRHALARSAVYGAAPAEERRAAHRALAGALPDRDADRRAWHLALAAVGPGRRRVGRARAGRGTARASGARTRSAAGVRARGPALAGRARRPRCSTRRPTRRGSQGRRARRDAARRGADARDERGLARSDRAPARPVVAAPRPGPEAHAILVAAAEQSAAEDPEGQS